MFCISIFIILSFALLFALLFTLLFAFFCIVVCIFFAFFCIAVLHFFCELCAVTGAVGGGTRALQFPNRVIYTLYTLCTYALYTQIGSIHLTG